ncbi:MAG: hypothetical protein AAB895_02320 [Patescibacteria group bacterium]|mgnify:FL=1
MNTQNGFGKVFLIIVIGFAAFAFLYKDKDGKTYATKISEMFTMAKDKVNGQVEGAKDTMKARDTQIQKEVDAIQ